MKCLYDKDKLVNEIAVYIDGLYDVQPEKIFKNDDTSIVFRHHLNKKWFGLIMKIKANKLGLERDDEVFVFNLKLDPMVARSSVDGHHVFESYHMNKTHWISFLIDEKTDEEKLHLFIDMSYCLTK